MCRVLSNVRRIRFSYISSSVPKSRTLYRERRVGCNLRILRPHRARGSIHVAHYRRRLDVCLTTDRVPVVVSVSILARAIFLFSPLYSALTHGANAFLKSPQPFGDDATCDEFARGSLGMRRCFFGCATERGIPFPSPPIFLSSRQAGRQAGRRDAPEAEEKPRKISRGSRRGAQLAVRAVIPTRVRGENSRELPRVFLLRMRGCLPPSFPFFPSVPPLRRASRVFLRDFRDTRIQEIDVLFLRTRREDGAIARTYLRQTSRK